MFVYSTAESELLISGMRPEVAAWREQGLPRLLTMEQGHCKELEKDHNDGEQK